MQADLITLIAVIGLILVGLGALAVMYHGIDRNYSLAQQLSRAEAQAAKYHAMATSWPLVDSRPRPVPLDDRPTHVITTGAGRHDPPVSQGGRTIQDRARGLR